MGRWHDDAGGTVGELIFGSINRSFDLHRTAAAPLGIDLRWYWIAAGLLFLVLSMLGSVGGRIRWIVFGLTAVWAASDGAPAPQQGLAAGATGLFWALLGLLAFGRQTRPSGAQRQSQVTDAAPSAQLVQDELADEPALLTVVFERYLRRREARIRRMLGRTPNTGRSPVG